MGPCGDAMVGLAHCHGLQDVPWCLPWSYLGSSMGSVALKVNTQKYTRLFNALVCFLLDVQQTTTLFFLVLFSNYNYTLAWFCSLLGVP